MSAFINSPIEALLFDHLTVVNNLWTWIALATAAVSFWWIRASSAAAAVISISLQSRHLSSNPKSPDGACGLPDVSSDVPETHAPPPLVSSPAVTSLPSIDVTKGKFVVYFEDDRDEVESESEVTVAGEWGYGGGLTESFEREVRMRMGDLGWYRCQDLTAINGNVVRLWDGVRL